MEKIGLIAGGGELPLIFAKEARKKGVKVVGFAIKELTSPEIDSACDKTYWFNPRQIAKFLLVLITERIKKIAMLGKVDKSIIYSEAQKKEGILSRFKGAQDKSDYTLLDRITAEFKKKGIDVIDCMEYLKDLVPAKGILTKRHPTEKEQDDISFGFRAAKEIAAFDIGQTIIVKDKVVVAVEALEGTNQTIERVYPLGIEGFSVIKVSRPHQDMRWDVPTIGPETVRLVAEKKGALLAIEEKRMFLIDRNSCVKIADDNNISIVVV